MVCQSFAVELRCAPDAALYIALAGGKTPLVPVRHDRYAQGSLSFC
jgi:hypothetical protein